MNGGAFDVAEKFAFEQFPWNGGAIDANQRPVFAAAGFVDGAGNQFLTGTGFAVISTLALVGATKSICWMILWMAALWPTISL